MNEIKFSQNWNRKLCCKLFTTLRLSGKHNLNDVVLVTLKDKERGLAVVMDKQEISLDMITDSLAYIDTGYNAEETKKILQKMHKNKNVNWDTQIIYFYVLKYELSDNLPCIGLNNEVKELTKKLEDLNTY